MAKEDRFINPKRFKTIVFIEVSIKTIVKENHNKRIPSEIVK